MRVVAAVVSFPLFALGAGLFFACGGTTPQGTVEAGLDSAKQDSGNGPEAPDFDGTLEAADGSTQCFLSSAMILYDPVAFCTMTTVLQDQHTVGFNGKSGTYASWNSTTLVPDNQDGKPIHDFHDDAAYGASCAAYHQWATLYGNPQLFDNDLMALAPVLEKELNPLPLEYDGELYFNLRNVAAGLSYLGDMTDADAINTIASNYARQIFTSFYTDLPLATAPGDAGADAHTDASADASSDAGPIDAGSPDSAADAEPDPAYDGDGIIGIDQSPVTGMPGYLYEPGKVTSAAAVLLDMAASNPTDPDADKWMAAIRRSLDHLYDRARDPASGLFYASLVTTGHGSDALGTLVTPNDTFSMEVEAEIVLYLTRAYRIVDNNTTLTAPDDGGSIDFDAATKGTLKPFTTFPFLSRAEDVIIGMDPLWDTRLPSGNTKFGGYIDGLIPSSSTLVTTKSTIANAKMFAALELQVHYAGVLKNKGGTGGSATPKRGEPGVSTVEAAHLNELRTLLTNVTENNDGGMMGFGSNDNFFTVLSGQVGYFDDVSQSFHFLKPPLTPPPQSYTAAAAAAVVDGFNEQYLNYKR